MIDLATQHELEDLHSRYVHAIDRGDFAMVRSLYTDDAIEVHGDFTGQVDEFLAWLQPLQAYFLATTHTVTNLLARADGDEIESEARAIAFLRIAGDPPYAMTVVNRLFDRYRKVDGRWLFCRRAVCVDWAEQYPAREGNLEATAPFPIGTRDGSDPVYAQAPALVAALRLGIPRKR